MKIVEIEVINWEKYNARKDIKNASWFRMNHDFFYSRHFRSLSKDGWISWWYILSECSKSSCSVIGIDTEQVWKITKVRRNNFERVLKQLEILGLIKCHVTSTGIDVTSTGVTNITNKQTNKQTENSSFFENREQGKASEGKEIESINMTESVSLDGPVVCGERDPHHVSDIDPDRVSLEMDRIRKQIGVLRIGNY